MTCWPYRRRRPISKCRCRGSTSARETGGSQYERLVGIVEYPVKNSWYGLRKTGRCKSDRLYAGWIAERAGHWVKMVCSACGHSSWWTDRYGNRKCGVCHPQPAVPKAAQPPKKHTKWETKTWKTGWEILMNCRRFIGNLFFLWAMIGFPKMILPLGQD